VPHRPADRSQAALAVRGALLFQAGEGGWLLGGKGTAAVNPAVLARLEAHGAPAACRLTRSRELRHGHQECRLPAGVSLLYLRSCPASQHRGPAAGHRREAKGLLTCFAPSLVTKLRAACFPLPSLFPRITRFCTEWEPRLCGDAGRCACRCRAVLWGPSPLIVTAK